MTAKIKICGVTLADDAARVSAAGADYVGINFWPKSKRYVELSRARMLADAIRAAGAAKVVGVFVDATAEDITLVHSRVDLDVIQLHGSESRDDVSAIVRAMNRPAWKAIAMRDARDLEGLETWPAEALLLDTPTPGKGGSGETFDWSLAREARRRYPARAFVLAGGLRPDNVAQAVAEVAPFAVDVASGVESAPGVKDADKLAAFVAAVRGT
ncbi:MAG: phosphoribosylanthranilate isomerase [Myxococcota bacterium]|nr:phosphoribosylanthranilate isomerase [Myxococcota bacterium]